MQRFKKSYLSMICGAALLVACGGGSSDPAKLAADFSAQGVKGSINGQNITIDLSGLGNCTTTVENMVIGINAQGANVSPDPLVARDYSQPVQFTITAADGSVAVYTVTVKGAACLNSLAPTPVPTPTPTPAPGPTPNPPSPPPPPPPVCVQPAYPTSGYSLVFKACDANGQPTYYDKSECVRDNTFFGVSPKPVLVWQGQTAAGTGLRGNDKTFTNFDNVNRPQTRDTAVPGVYPNPTQAQIDDLSNSIGFQNEMNRTNLCGFNDWRMPTQSELLTLVTGNTAPRLDSNWFVNMWGFGDGFQRDLFWTSNGRMVDASLDSAMYVEFFAGNSTYGRRYSPISVRLVRNVNR